MKNGKYKTKNGSIMIISGKHGGIRQTTFDWLEEGGCVECKPEAYDDEGYLVWRCDYCEGGKAELFSTLD